MSRQLIDRSPDLRRLQEEGYRVQVRNNILCVFDVPYLNSARAITRGTLFMPLTANGDVAARPGDHQAYLKGEKPHRSDGSPLDPGAGGPVDLDKDIHADFSFSRKPKGTDGNWRNYADFHEKVTTYVALLCGTAVDVDPDATARLGPIAAPADDPSPFVYIDTASGRAGINLVSRKLDGLKIGVVGVGGTGSYVVDLVAKTRVAEIHLFDGDSFGTHNAFRAPGAPSVEYLRDAPKKVDHLAAIYSHMHRGLKPHPVFLDSSNADLLRPLSFVFLCVDASEAKRDLVERLQSWSVPFVDVGLGIYHREDLQSLGGLIRWTTSTPAHPSSRRFIPVGKPNAENEYERNIQVAELNSLAAALAVVKWKRLAGLYLDFRSEHNSIYMINRNLLANEDEDPAEAPEA